MFSKKIQKVIDEIRKCYDFETYKVILNNNLSTIVDEFNIGKIDILFKVSKGVFDKTLVEKKWNVYSGNYENNPLEIFYNLEYNEFISIRIYPLKLYSWNNDEISVIEIFGNIILSSLTRIRYKILIEDASMRDGLTNSYNISGLMRILVNKDLSLYNCIFLNIKNFKYINKILGHSDANRALVMFSRVVEKNLDKDEIFVRAGGDNFILFIKKENTQKTFLSLSAITISGVFNGVMKTFDLSCKIGIYVIEDKISSIADCIEKANIALGIAKNINKKDIIFFDEHVEKRISTEKEIISLFDDALFNKEFLVYYQPKVDAINNELKGAEALVRWCKDEKIISPGVFIPVLENENHICKLDFYVLETVCQNIRDWIDNGITPVRISVNFSKKHLSNKNFEKEIVSIIDKYNVPHKYVEIEITESNDFSNTERINNFISILRRNNIQISLDDFGTGYSSFGTLMNINFDVIKLDKSFIDNINNGVSNNDIIINLINLIKLFGSKIVAEGVETTEQLDFLIKNGCTIIQGYIFDKPLKHKDFENRLIKKFYK